MFSTEQWLKHKHGLLAHPQPYSYSSKQKAPALVNAENRQVSGQRLYQVAAGKAMGTEHCRALGQGRKGALTALNCCKPGELLLLPCGRGLLNWRVSLWDR